MRRKKVHLRGGKRKRSRKGKEGRDDLYLRQDRQCQRELEGNGKADETAGLLIILQL